MLIMVVMTSLLALALDATQRNATIRYVNPNAGSTQTVIDTITDPIDDSISDEEEDSQDTSDQDTDDSSDSDDSNDSDDQTNDDTNDANDQTNDDTNLETEQDADQTQDDTIQGSGTGTEQTQNSTVPTQTNNQNLSLNLPAKNETVRNADPSRIQKPTEDDSILVPIDSNANLKETIPIILTKEEVIEYSTDMNLEESFSLSTAAKLIEKRRVNEAQYLDIAQLIVNTDATTYQREHLAKELVGMEDSFVKKFRRQLQSEYTSAQTKQQLEEFAKGAYDTSIESYFDTKTITNILSHEKSYDDLVAELFGTQENDS